MYGTRPKSLGTRRGLNSPFIPPIKPAENKSNEGENAERNSNSNDPEKILGNGIVKCYSSHFLIFIHWV